MLCAQVPLSGVQGSERITDVEATMESLDGQALIPIFGTLDPEIAPIVHFLRKHGVNTMNSCQGGDGHMCKYPTVWFTVSRTHPLSEVYRVADLLLHQNVDMQLELSLRFDALYKLTVGAGILSGKIVDRNRSHFYGTVEFLGDGHIPKLPEQ